MQHRSESERLPKPLPTNPSKLYAQPAPDRALTVAQLPCTPAGTVQMPKRALTKVPLSSGGCPQGPLIRIPIQSPQYNNNMILILYQRISWQSF